MDLYSYLDHGKTSQHALVFQCEAPDISAADKLASAAGHNTQRLACCIGIKLVVLFRVTKVKLWQEASIFVQPTAKSPGKYHLNLPGWWYTNDELVTKVSDSKSKLVEKHKALIKSYIFNPEVQLLWELPFGLHTCRIVPKANELKELLA